MSDVSLGVCVLCTEKIEGMTRPRQERRHSEPFGTVKIIGAIWEKKKKRNSRLAFHSFVHSLLAKEQCPCCAMHWLCQNVWYAIGGRVSISFRNAVT